MKDYLREIISRQPDPAGKRSLAREYLQARILEGMQRSGAMTALAFQGGTALRFLYNISRFSEDLDIALERPASGYDLPACLRAARSGFEAEGYGVEVKLNDRGIVHSAFLRFPGLPYELGFSSQPGEALSVKVEVDTRPPQGAGLEISLVRRYIPLRIQHHDRASLMAGKLHTILQRDYAKGRDLYDLMWYLADPAWPAPNLPLLKNALTQTGWKGPNPDPENWRGLVYTRLTQLDWKAALADVRPFLERPHEINLLTLEGFRQLLQQGDGSG